MLKHQFLSKIISPSSLFIERKIYKFELYKLLDHQQTKYHNHVMDSAALVIQTQSSSIEIYQVCH